MTILFRKQHSDYWHCGSPNDPRLLHSDSSDQIRVLSPQVGEGYIQEIPLQEGLSLLVIDYSFHSICSFQTTLDDYPSFEFEFCLDGPAVGRASLVPHIDPPESLIIQAIRPRQLKVEVILSHSMFEAYSHNVVQHLHPQDQETLHNWASWVHSFYREHKAKSPQEAFTQLLSGDISSAQIPINAVDPFNHLEFCSLGRLWMSITSEMQQLLHQILSCPNGGRIRRDYLKVRALQLVDLVMKGLNHSNAISYPLADGDLECIYEAGKILACNLSHPPSVEQLARQVGLNRFKLNEGFHQVYGMTPFRYLRSRRLDIAHYLLTTSDLPIKSIAHKVGYTSRSNFANAFRHRCGVNPKVLQLHNRNLAQAQGVAS